MQQRFHLFVRHHADGLVAASVLTHPHYTAVGRELAAVRAELHDVLARDLALDALPSGTTTFWEDLEVDRISLQVRAIQHERLITVPLSFTFAVHAVDRNADDDRYTVHVPRLHLEFSLFGRGDLRAWIEEQIRGELHLRDVHELYSIEAARRERIELLEVRWHGAGRYLKQVRASRVIRAVEVADRSGSRLAGVGVDLVEEARQGRIPRALGRKVEVDRLVQTLARHQQSSALLVGAPGVGKTALVHELCHRIAADAVPPRLQGAAVWYVSGNRLVAGMRYVGEWQERAFAIARTLQATGDVLYVGNLVELLSTGTGGGLDAGPLFLPFLDRDAFPLLAEATPDGLVRAEHLHPAFVRALRRLDLHGMARDAALAVLEVIARRLAKEAGARTEVTDEALSAAVDVLLRYGAGDGLPGSGIGLLERMVKGNPSTKLDRSHAIAAFSQGTGLPPSVVDPEAPLDEAVVHEGFAARVVGQPEAARVLTELVLVIKAGLTDPSRPLGALLLLGPTGVGKTETAKALAQFLFGDDERLVRFDMSEYAAHGAAQRLVDGPGGQGLLTKRVRERPFGIVLLDEIEKAEPTVFDVLLQVLGEGRLTDGTGATVSFRHTIVLMTSNLGAGEPAPVGLVPRSSAGEAARYRRAAEAFFRPEFVNRLDALVPYRSLTEDVVRQIARGLLTAALTREGLGRRGVRVTWDEPVLEHVVRVGYDPAHGARPMRRAIETEVLAPLARVLARGGHGAVLALRVRDGRIDAEEPEHGDR